VVYEEAGSIPASEFVGEDRHHPTPSSEEEGLSVQSFAANISLPNFTNFTVL